VFQKFVVNILTLTILRVESRSEDSDAVYAYIQSDTRELLMGLIAWNVILTILLIIVLIALAVAFSNIKRVHRHTRGR